MMLSLALDRIRHRRTDGLRFLRVLATGRGSSTAPGIQWGRTALFCLFDDDQRADQFIRRLRRQPGLSESWHVKMHGAGGHGSWSGCSIPNLTTTAAARDAGTLGPMIMVTRANVRLKSWRVFTRESPTVDRELQESDGLRAVVAIGEAPVLRQGTFSVWRDLPAMVDFARNGPRHRRAMARARSGRWFGEEMFARFSPYWSTGTWDGRDPLRETPS